MEMLWILSPATAISYCNLTPVWQPSLSLGTGRLQAWRCVQGTAGTCLQNHPENGNSSPCLKQCPSSSCLQLYWHKPLSEMDKIQVPSSERIQANMSHLQLNDNQAGRVYKKEHHSRAKQTVRETPKVLSLTHSLRTLTTGNSMQCSALW